MPAARYWRLVGIRPYNGGDLELSELHLYDAAGRVDAAATLTCNYAPASGTLAALKDANTATDCRFAGADIRAPSFAFTWDFGAGTADVLGVRAAASADAGAFLSMCDLQYFTGTVWATTNLGRHVFPGARAYTAAPTQVPDFITPRDVWVQRTVAGTDWQWVSCSADGLKLAAADTTRYYTSVDGGATWTARSTGQSASGTVSADGSTLYTALASGSVYRSTDMGATRTTLSGAGSRAWTNVACSADGAVVAAVSSTAGVYVSTNSGSTWTRYLSTQVFFVCAVSGDGTRIVVGGQDGSDMQMSTDSGATWSSRPTAGARQWTALAMNPGGARILAGTNGGPLLLSTDAGATWAAQSLPAAGIHMAVDMSDDGQTLLAVYLNGYSWLSEDGGATWGTLIVGTASAAAGCLSADGRRRALGNPSNSALFSYLRRQTIYDLPLVATSTTGADFVAASSPVGDAQTTPLRGARTALDAEFGGPCAIAGVTKTKGTPNTPYRCRVRLLRDKDALLVRETWSDPTTGVFVFPGLNPAHTYTAYAQDHMGNFRAVIADRVTPEVPA